MVHMRNRFEEGVIVKVYCQYISAIMETCYFLIIVVCINAVNYKVFGTHVKNIFKAVINFLLS